MPLWRSTATLRSSASRARWITSTRSSASACAASHAVPKARVILILHAVLATLAAGVLTFAGYAASRAVSVQPPSARQLVAACSRFALPDVSPASIAALGLGSLAVAVFALSCRSFARQAIATRRFLAAL